MKELTNPFNVETKIDGFPSISWDRFKWILENKYGWTYDSDEKGFYTRQKGKKRFKSSIIIEILASTFGHYEDMGDYIDVR
jgi:hypothetical protein